MDGRFDGDVLTIETDRAPGRALLEPVMRAAQLVATLPALERSREYAASELAALPPRLRSLDPTEPYAVDVSPGLRALAAEVDART